MDQTLGKRYASNVRVNVKHSSCRCASNGVLQGPALSPIPLSIL